MAPVLEAPHGILAHSNRAHNRESGMHPAGAAGAGHKSTPPCAWRSQSSEARLCPNPRAMVRQRPRARQMRAAITLRCSYSSRGFRRAADDEATHPKQCPRLLQATSIATDALMGMDNWTWSGQVSGDRHTEPSKPLKAKPAWNSHGASSLSPSTITPVHHPFDPRERAQTET